MVTIELKRKYLPTQTLGEIIGPGIKLVSIELPWKNNKKRESCIPEGKYLCIPRYSKKYGFHFEIKDVINRDAILIHIANYARELLGCIAPGLKHADIDKDGNLDAVSSKAALDVLLNKFKDGFYLKIHS